MGLCKSCKRKDTCYVKDDDLVICVDYEKSGIVEIDIYGEDV